MSESDSVNRLLNNFSVRGVWARKCLRRGLNMVVKAARVIPTRIKKRRLIMHQIGWRNWLLCAVGMTLTAFSARAADLPKVLFLTQSKGFQHSVVKRPDPQTLAHAEKILTEICKGAFDVECTQDAST